MVSFLQKVVLAIGFLLMAVSVSAQDLQVRRGNCLPSLGGDVTRGATLHKLSAPKTDWDPQRVYRQMVVLVAYADCDFSMENPQEYYQQLFNEQGYAVNGTKGCVADYFRDQSGGLFNLSFDIYGPVKVSASSKVTTGRNYALAAIREATQRLVDSLQIDFVQYDWYDNKTVPQIIYILAGLSGNMTGNDGYMWPNTSSFSTITTADGYRLSNYSASAELFVAGRYCGLGTICHEFSHSLGLPDIYPTSNNGGYSVVDEWDLMDGGNFVRNGWCPPNYTALEKMLMGWLTPVELDEPTTVTNMKPVSEGGDAYLVRHTDNEYYLLENRQWTGWDSYLPGKGLVVYHVDYNESAWRGNSVNNSKTHRRFQLVNADNLDYEAWDSIIGSSNPRKSGHSRYLSTSAYPWTTDSTDFVNNLLTDDSTPASLMFNTNSAGSEYLSKPITNISVTEEGLVFFGYRLGTAVSPTVFERQKKETDDCYYNLQGQRVTSPGRGLYIINGKIIRF